MAMRIGYARVSRRDQDPAMQEDELRRAGCEKVVWEKGSGARSDRPGLAQALDYTRKDDTLVVWRLDRLGRSLKDLISLVEDLQERGVEFQSLREAIDTNTSGGRLVFHIFGALSEFEREVIRERTQAGLDAARARGRKGGRKKALTDKQVKTAQKMLRDPETTVTEVSEALGVSRSTIYRWVGAVRPVRETARDPRREPQSAH
jgi:DNA invertase Pin-like site-specific DNA recombinase